jgi:hypothetical protein
MRRKRKLLPPPRRLVAKRQNKILFIGDLALPWYSGVHWASSFEKLGIEVVRLPEHLATDDKIRALCKEHTFDFILVSKHFGSVWSMSELKKHGVVILWTLDLYFGLKRETELQRDIWQADIVLSPDGGNEEKFKKLGINHHWIKPAVYSEEMSLLDREKKHDVIFVGTYHSYLKEWPYRKKLIEWLRITYGKKFELFPQDKVIRGEELNELYASTKVVVGDSVYSPKYWSDRIYETVGRGGFIIHPRIDGMDLKDGLHYVGYNYGDFNALKKKIDYYLEHDREREKIREEGFKFVKDNDTYLNRCQEVLDIYDSHLNTHNKK